MSTARQPRVSLIVQGATVQCLGACVSMSKDHKCDTAEATLVLEALPPGMDADWWSTANDIAVQVQFQADAGSGAVKLFDGKVDHVDTDWCERTMKISARDKAAKLLDKKTTKKHINKKPHEVVQDLASEGGLATDVDQIAEKAGKLVQIDFASIVHRVSNWAAIQTIADKFGMVAYTTAGTLYFKPPDEKLPVYKITYTPPTPEGYATGNFVMLKTARNVVLGRPVKCHVHSWNHKEKKLNEAVSQEDGVGDPLEYYDHAPNLSKDQAGKRAKNNRDGVTKHEFDISVDLPGDPSLTPRYMLELTGTQTAYDQQYEIQSVQHRISMKEGYRMSVSSKAKSKKRGKKK